jgi:hypothetical protein
MSKILETDSMSVQDASYFASKMLLVQNEPILEIAKY